MYRVEATLDAGSRILTVPLVLRFAAYADACEALRDQLDRLPATAAVTGRAADYSWAAIQYADGSVFELTVLAPRD